MATVGEIATWVIKSQADGYNRTSDVLPVINEVHKLFYKHESSQGVIIDPATGRLPALPTTLNVYQYDAPVVGGQTAWCVANVFLEALESRDYNFSDYNFRAPPLVNTFDYREFGGNYYYPYQFARSLDSLVGEVCSLTFSRNPGTTTNTFFLLMYKQPREITSDRQQLQIPDRDGAHKLYFFPAVMKLIEAQNHGNYMEAVEYIETVLKPKVWKVMNSGQQGRRHRTKARYS